MAPRSVEADQDRWKLLGQFVIETREKRDMDQRDLVEQAGVSQSVVSKIENGRPDNGRVRASTLRKLSTALLLPALALEHLALGADLADVRTEEEAHWRVVEQAGGWEGRGDETEQPRSISSADGIDLDEVRRLDPKGWADVMDHARRVRDEARRRR